MVSKDGSLKKTNKLLEHTLEQPDTEADSEGNKCECEFG